jgi:hypothetical protein
MASVGDGDVADATVAAEATVAADTFPLPVQSRNAFPLWNLPQEVFDQVLECLVPDPPEIGGTRPVTYDKLMPGEEWYDFTRCRRGLRSLCLVSRGMSRLAQPLLYRVISLLDEDGMMLLFRSLTERPALGGFTRFLSCHLTLTQENVIREMRRTIGRTIKSFRPNLTELGKEYPHVAKALRLLIETLPLLSTNNGDFDDVPQMVLFYIMSFMSKLETLMLQVPITDDDPEYVALFDRVNPSRLLRMRTGVREGGPAPGADNPPWRHIHTLLLQGDPELQQHFEGNDCDCEVPEIWGVATREYRPLFDALPSLSVLEVSSDDGIWEDTRFKKRPYLRGIKELFLHHSIANPRGLYHVLTNAPNLRRLYMDPRRDDEWPLDPEAAEVDVHAEALDVALLRRRNQLRDLDIAWFDLSGQTSLLGPEGRLTCLPQMARLKKLFIQLVVLYGTNPATLLTPMADLLPPGLAELTLEEWWWESVETYDDSGDWTEEGVVDYYESKTEYRAQALAILGVFARDVEAKMPMLRKVTFLTKIQWTWRTRDGEIWTHFGELEGMFRAAGVAFLVDEV